MKRGNSDKRQASVEIDPRTEDAIEELQKMFGVNSRSAAIRAAIALSRAMAPSIGKDYSFRAINPDTGKEREIVLAR